MHASHILHTYIHTTIHMVLFACLQTYIHTMIHADVRIELANVDYTLSEAKSPTMHYTLACYRDIVQPGVRNLVWSKLAKHV